MRKYFLILLLYGCTTSKPKSIIAARRFTALSTPMTNRQLTELAALQGEQLQIQDSLISSQGLEIAALKSTAVVINSIFTVDSLGFIRFKSFVQMDSAAFRFVYVGKDNYDSTKILRDTLTPVIDSSVIIIPF